jgi:hypothetical protein
MSEDYLMYRLEFFKKYTLNSLLNQTKNDFKIFLQLGNRYKTITDKYELDPKVVKCYDHGVDEYKKISTPYLVISRIDSDDMYRRTAIDKIRKNIIFKKYERTVSVFRENICWDQINGCIMPHRKPTSPFFTHVFHRSLYRNNWKKFKDMHFCQHGDHGAGDRQGKELPAGQVCVIKHGQNVSHLKRDLPPFVLSDEQKEILSTIGKSDSNLPQYDAAVWNPEKMGKILKKFGVSYDGRGDDG